MASSAQKTTRTTTRGKVPPTACLPPFSDVSVLPVARLQLDLAAQSVSSANGAGLSS
jgi:hypothetical protein